MRHCIICGVIELRAQWARCLLEMKDNGLEIEHLKRIPKMTEQTHVWAELPSKESPFYGKGAVESLSGMIAGFNK